MNSQPNHEAALTETIREGRAVIVTGTGVSIAASFDATTKQPHPQASWAGLLKDGLKWLKDHKLIDDDIADAQLKLLEKNPQTHRFISAAEDVTDGMGGAKSKHFSDWLKRTIGSIKAHDRSALDALEAIRQQGNLLSTTNYDGLLLSGHSQLAPVTWLDTDALIGVARHWDTGKIIFLHGYWRQPESVVLDWKSYDKIARDERYRQDLAAFWKTSIWVYVGCGVSGLADPDFGLLLERYGERARQAGHWDYCLVRDDQRDEFQAYFDTNRLNIRAIPFGKDYTDLPQYLHSLLPAPVPPAPVTPPSAALASADPKMSARASKIRSLYLKDARRDFEARLAASVHHARFIDLGIQDDPAAIKPAWGYHNPETRQSYDTVAEAFAGCDRRLLLLGSPGSGKTTALLHLAKLLVLEAEQNPEAPIPFVVNLSKFRFERSEGAKLWPSFVGWGGASANGNGYENLDTKLEDWLVSEIAAFPGLSHELARDWIRHGRVAALLDGLDEFNDERRGDLVRLLNSTFLRYYPDLIVVICSRTNEYLVLRSSEETRLQLRRCVQLQPLSDEQIADYLDAAQARALLSALPDDPALRELAKTPLTLSMLVLSYGGLAPSDLPKSGSLSESRHHLFESYVTRMLQRRERRKRNVLFDDSKANDIPVSEYSYHPDLVHRWLGWLALALSARMRTSFSVANIHSILSIGVQPARQPFNFSAVYFTLGVLLSVSLCLIAQLIIPIKSAGLLSYVFIVVSSLLLLPLAASGSREWAGGSLFLRVMYPSIVLLDITAVTRLLCAILPGGISPLPVSVILTFAVLLVLLATDAGFRDDDFQKGSLWFVVGVGAFTGLQFLPGDWHLPFLDRAWWQTAIAAISFGLGFDSVLGENEPLRERIGTFVAAIALATFIALATRWIPEPNWTTGFVAIGVSLMLILAVVDVPAAVLILLGYSLIALTGGVVANYHGAILNLTFFGFLFLIWVAVEKSWLVRENELVKGVVVRGQIAADRTLKLLDRIILSPCLWRIAAIGRRFPWRHNRFISFCKEAFLLKQSSQECEFVHRLLRDYFALLELRPRLSASDKHRRLDAIRFLGYQGEAALDVLEEFAGDQDPSVRAAALIGLSHISSPIVTRYFELRMDDPNPLVRQAIIRGIFRLPRKDFAELLSRLQPLGDGCELAPLLDALQSDDSFVHIGKIYEVIKKLGKVAMEPMKGRLRSRNRRVREEFVGALAQFFNEEQQQLLSRDVDGEFPWLDPTKPISRSRVIHCGRHLGLTEGDVLARYQALADEFGLKIKL